MSFFGLAMFLILLALFIFGVVRVAKAFGAGGVFGFFACLAGLGTTVAGIVMNADQTIDSVMRHGRDPGNSYIIVGCILLFVGIVVLGLLYWKKNKS